MFVFLTRVVYDKYKTFQRGVVYIMSAFDQIFFKITWLTEIKLDSDLLFQKVIVF